MPLPLIAIVGLVVAGAGAAVSVGGAISASSDNDEAEKNNKRANSLVEEAKTNLENARDLSKNALENLGRKKINTLQTSIATFVSLFERIKNIEIHDSAGLDELSKFKIDKQGIIELKAETQIAESVAKGLIGGSLAGGAVAFGAWSAATAFATASTGTAIATLSGAAATNATLAFFGGGALAAGGLGMAAGTAVLGGLVAGPALAVLGIVMAANASENLEKSKTNIAKAKEFKAQADLACEACYAVQKRANLFSQVLNKVDTLFSALLEQMEAVIDHEGTDYSRYSDDAKKTIAAVLSHAQSIKAILDTPILDVEGKLTAESEKVAKTVCDKMQLDIPDVFLLNSFTDNLVLSVD